MKVSNIDRVDVVKKQGGHKYNTRVSYVHDGVTRSTLLKGDLQKWRR